MVLFYLLGLIRTRPFSESEGMEFSFNGINSPYAATPVKHFNLANRPSPAPRIDALDPLYISNEVQYRDGLCSALPDSPACRQASLELAKLFKTNRELGKRSWVEAVVKFLPDRKAPLGRVKQEDAVERRRLLQVVKTALIVLLLVVLLKILLQRF